MVEIAEFFSKLLDTTDFPARWHCGKWSDFHGWVYIISNVLIWGAYFMIPFLIIRYISKQKSKIKFNKLYLLFAFFIVSCGTAHFIDAYIFWVPLYRLNALLLAFTAIISWVTVFYLVKLLPTAFALKSPIELEKEIELRKVKENELLKKNATLLHAETLAKLCTWTFNKQTGQLSWSESAEKIFNLPKNYTLSFEEFIKAIMYEDQDHFRENFEKTIKYKHFNKLYFRIITPYKEIKDVVCVGEVMCDESGEVVEIVGTIQDITEKKQQLRTIEEKNTKLLEVSHIQSHAIRGQVATILGLSELFDDSDNNKQNKIIIEGIKVATNNLDQLIKDLTGVIEKK